MRNSIKLLLVGLALGSAVSMAEDCTAPTLPTLPDGATASLEQMLALYDNLSPAQKKRVLAMADEMSPSIDWQQATRILSDIIQLIALGA